MFNPALRTQHAPAAPHPSPVAPTWKMGASLSLLMATMNLLSLMPATCWMAPEMPMPMYRSGATVLPVWPTCRQPP
jgi:hypothetical protein